MHKRVKDGRRGGATFKERIFFQMRAFFLSIPTSKERLFLQGKMKIVSVYTVMY